MTAVLPQGGHEGTFDKPREIIENRRSLRFILYNRSIRSPIPMIEAEKAIVECLSVLVGEELSACHRAADMLTLHFGPVRQDIGPLGNRRLIGAWGLHIQCPWRLEVGSSIYTGRSDLWEPETEPGDDFDWQTWDFEAGNLRDKRMALLLSGEAMDNPAATAKSRDRIVVEGVQADNFGGARISMSQGYCLAMFPDGTRSEDWRFFSLGESSKHFVVAGKKLS
ncbi:hypothetical protein AAGS40_27485 (plasmid) [Paraburkholderia sp. PREW-6R]|uniref:hypothetical protein n=1 Tax=Paraburkholderia sp. PREW-6R TaxID=3141544 RepID=UPI0031F553FD